MINIKKSLFDTVKHHIALLRKQAKNDPQIFKKILQAIIIDDMYEWTHNRCESQEVQKKLKELRQKYLLNNCEFIIDRTIDRQIYGNVNVAQNIYTWQIIDEECKEVPTENITKIYTDCSMVSDIEYIPEEKKIVITKQLTQHE